MHTQAGSPTICAPSLELAMQTVGASSAVLTIILQPIVFTKIAFRALHTFPFPMFAKAFTASQLDSTMLTQS